METCVQIERWGPNWERRCPRRSASNSQKHAGEDAGALRSEHLGDAFFEDAEAVGETLGGGGAAEETSPLLLAV